ncbi:MAG TPA: class I SAM-dependent methyltransferase [Actinomycetota bacterium]
MPEQEPERIATQYDAFADAYGDGGPYNELYERPAMLELLGEVAGSMVLDVGCGSGVLTERLLARGAEVVGFDSSEQMLRRARGRLGADAPVRLHDLHEPISWLADAGIDVVVGSLVMHYIEDWQPVLAEFRRVLRPTGRLVFSTHHPFCDFVLLDRPDYFTVEQIGDQWSHSGVYYPVRFWRRPLSVIVSDLVAAGFVIEQLAEPRPTSWEGFTERDRERLSTQPWFLFVVARAVEPR